MKKNYIAPILILAVMFILMLASSWNDSAIMDELAHIPAAYSYLTLRDFRLNPEHPPLIKDLAALPLLFLRLNFPTDTPYWQNDVNGQWAQGARFLYESGNNPERILFWSRLPIILLALLFGWMLFRFAEKRFNRKTALLTLIFYAFSPTFLTHSRFVTTDLGASLGFFIGLVAFINFLETPSWKNAFTAGVALGIAELLKFSLVLLVPIYGALVVLWVIVQKRLFWREKLSLLFNILLKTFALGMVGLFIIWGVYAYHVWDYPQERQLRDAQFILSSFGFRPAVDFDLWLIKSPLLRPLGQYLLGVLMVAQRAAGGNTSYFLGEVSAAGSRLYFPLLYLFKEPLAFHILSLLALWLGLNKIKKANYGHSVFEIRHWLKKSTEWISGHFMLFSAGFLVLFYWAYSIRSPLNIGVRHILPTFPFIYLIVAREIADWTDLVEKPSPKNWLEWLKNVYQIYIKSLPRRIFVYLLVLWLILDTLAVFPNFMPYYNELAGGAKNGYTIAVDSNYDWGQDLKRLAKFVEKENINKIAVDYFGGGNPRYYLGDKFEPWWSARGQYHGWFAISATTQMGAFGKTAPGFLRKPEDSYEWLKEFAPVARIGYSIFVYNLP